MIVKILDVVIAGLLLGGLYALIAMGLSLQYGVARVLNIAHGEFIMLGAFATCVTISSRRTLAVPLSASPGCWESVSVASFPTAAVPASYS